MFPRGQWEEDAVLVNGSRDWMSDMCASGGTCSSLRWVTGAKVATWLVENEQNTHEIYRRVWKESQAGGSWVCFFHRYNFICQTEGAFVWSKTFLTLHWSSRFTAEPESNSVGFLDSDWQQLKLLFFSWKINHKHMRSRETQWCEFSIQFSILLTLADLWDHNDRLKRACAHLWYALPFKLTSQETSLSSWPMERKTIKWSNVHIQ